MFSASIQCSRQQAPFAPGSNERLRDQERPRAAPVGPLGPSCTRGHPCIPQRRPQDGAARGRRVAQKAARATAEQIDAVLNSPPAQQQAPLTGSPPTVTLQQAAAFGRGLAGPS